MTQAEQMYVDLRVRRLGELWLSHVLGLSTPEMELEEIMLAADHYAWLTSADRDPQDIIDAHEKGIVRPQEAVAAVEKGILYL